MRQIIAFILCLLFTQLAHAQRYALVIGNSNYATGALANPVNDADDMAALLQTKGFEVKKLRNANKRNIKEAIAAFTNKLHQKDAVGLFYFAGHGIEVAGRNYLVPIGANISNETDVEYESIDAGRVMSGMEHAGNNLNMVILDACRNNPYIRRFRSSRQGLQRMGAKGSLVLYATAAGDVASDGSGRNGLFTKHLMAEINKPGLKVEDVYKETADSVYRATNGKQFPTIEGGIIGKFYFTQSVSAGVAPQSEVAVELPESHQAQQAEMLFWDSIKNETDSAFFISYLNKYPQGRYVELAKLKINVRDSAYTELDNEVAKAFPEAIFLTVKVSPENARVRILNSVPKYHPAMKLQTGIEYTIEVSHAGYQRQIKKIRYKNGGNKLLSLVLLPEKDLPDPF